jgi:hypothetical protein
MLQLMDPVSLRLESETRRARALATMRAARGGRMRRQLGGWLVSVGSRLAEEERRVRAVARAPDHLSDGAVDSGS